VLKSVARYVRSLSDKVSAEHNTTLSEIPSSFYTWLSCPYSLLYDPAIHREVNLWTKRFTQLIANEVSSISQGEFSVPYVDMYTVVITTPYVEPDIGRKAFAHLWSCVTENSMLRCLQPASYEEYRGILQFDSDNFCALRVTPKTKNDDRMCNHTRGTDTGGNKESFSKKRERLANTDIDIDEEMNDDDSDESDYLDVDDADGHDGRGDVEESAELFDWQLPVTLFAPPPIAMFIVKVFQNLLLQPLQSEEVVNLLQGDRVNPRTLANKVELAAVSLSGPSGTFTKLFKKLLSADVVGHNDTSGSENFEQPTPLPSVLKDSWLSDISSTTWLQSRRKWLAFLTRTDDTAGNKQSHLKLLLNCTDKDLADRWCWEIPKSPAACVLPVDHYTSVNFAQVLLKTLLLEPSNNLLSEEKKHDLKASFAALVKVSAFGDAVDYKKLYWPFVLRDMICFNCHSCFDVNLPTEMECDLSDDSSESQLYKWRCRHCGEPYTAEHFQERLIELFWTTLAALQRQPAVCMKCRRVKRDAKSVCYCADCGHQLGLRVTPTGINNLVDSLSAFCKFHNSVLLTEILQYYLPTEAANGLLA